MALDYRKCAEEIAANIGGGSNVISAAHCATRLRLVIADNSKLGSNGLLASVISDSLNSVGSKLGYFHLVIVGIDGKSLCR